jgi:uncharacterized Zn finger protein
MSPQHRPEDWWRPFPASKPLPVEGGIATSKQRGAMAEAWWSRRFVDTLEAYGLGGRMQRGRRYARTGQVVDLEVEPGRVTARVQGSRPTPYEIAITAQAPTDEQWQGLEQIVRARVGFVARLMAGEVPPELEDAFTAAGVLLLPTAWSQLTARCNCPDHENPCKHIAAVLYVFADQLDRDPWLLVTWRGRTRADLLAHLSTAAPTGVEDDALPPWWPLRPDGSEASIGRATVHRSGARAHALDAAAPPPDPPHRVLERLDAMDLGGRGTPLADLLRPAYEAMTRVEPTAETDDSSES